MKFFEGGNCSGIRFPAVDEFLLLMLIPFFVMHETQLRREKHQLALFFLKRFACIAIIYVVND